MGEIGLAGEVRQVPGATRRLAEAERLGFGRAIVPVATPAVEGMDLVRVGSLGEALTLALAPPEPGAGGRPADRVSTRSTRRSGRLVEVI